MRWPNVYQRSAPWARRDVEQESGGDYRTAALFTIAVVPALLREAEAVGAAALARYLGQALLEAEGVVHRSEQPRTPPAARSVKRAS